MLAVFIVNRYIPCTYLSDKWKFVPFDNLLKFITPYFKLIATYLTSTEFTNLHF